VHFQRKPYGSHFSIEKVFNAIRRSSPRDVIFETRACRFQSRGILRRLLNVFEAPFHQGDVNHITGDVYYLALLLSKRKTILTILDCVSLQSTTGLNHSRILWFWYLLPVRRVAAVTVISKFTKDWVLRYTGCDPQMVHVIPCPVSAEFVPSPKEFNADEPILLQVGTSEHNKNLIRVAEALRGVPCRLDIIGRLTDRQRRALETNSILYANQWALSDEEVVERYRKCDMVVFASTYEGFGMPIIEANATGRPVVTSNIGPMPEVAGSAACLVDPFDCASIREGILRIINDTDYRNSLIVRGFENVKRFQPDVIAAQYANLYREIHLRD
jgi:glycosyltransferase involved in cell wall biosynthesis